MAALNGKVVAQGSQFSLSDVVRAGRRPRWYRAPPPVAADRSIRRRHRCPCGACTGGHHGHGRPQRHSRVPQQQLHVRPAGGRRPGTLQARCGRDCVLLAHRGRRPAGPAGPRRAGSPPRPQRYPRIDLPACRRVGSAPAQRPSRPVAIRYHTPQEEIRYDDGPPRRVQAGASAGVPRAESSNPARFPPPGRASAPVRKRLLYAAP